MSDDVDRLIYDIEQAFSFAEMPPSSVVLAEGSDSHDCYGLSDDLDGFRGKEASGDVIRCIHQEILCLSPRAWLWILPYYLKYCLSPEGRYNQFETESLIYTLSPSEEVGGVVEDRLALLDISQLAVLERFLVYLSSQSWWQSYCPEELSAAIFFIHSVKDGRVNQGGF